MPANRFNGFTEYGVGIGLRIPHYRHILEQKPVVDWFEIISKLHDRWWPPFGCTRSHPRTISRRATWRFDVLRVGRASEPRTSAAAEEPRRPNQDPLALGPSLLGQCGRAIHS